MRNTPNQGLAGKARRKRVRSRTTRLYQQQLIEDYVHNRNELGKSPLDRSIPIGHRREFVPTAEPGLDDSAAGQLDLSLTPVDEDRDAAFIAVPKDEAETFRPAQREIAKAVAASKPVAVGRPVATSEVEGVVASEFTWRGFAFGCAIGGSAAAVLLVFIRIAFA